MESTADAEIEVLSAETYVFSAERTMGFQQRGLGLWVFSRERSMGLQQRVLRIFSRERTIGFQQRGL